MTDINIKDLLLENYNRLFCPKDTVLTGGEQKDTGNEYPNAPEIDLMDHISGIRTFALDLPYKNSAGTEYCIVGVGDIDTYDAESLETLQLIRDELTSHGITVLTAYSGRKGYHFYLPSEPIPVSLMRKVLEKIKAKFTFKGELIPKDGNRCKIAPCLHKPAGNWSYLFEDSPYDSPIKAGELPEDFYETQNEILDKATPTPAGVMIAYAMEEENTREKGNPSDMIPDMDELKGMVPPCIEALVHKGGSASLGTWDKNSLTLATYCNSSDKDKHAVDNLVKTMAKKSADGSVETTKTEAEKKKHFRKAQRAPSARTPFSCLSVLKAKKELGFDCDQCPGKPSGIQTESDAVKNLPQELEPPLADAFLTYTINEGMPREHVSPWIMPGDNYKSHFYDKDSNRIDVELKFKSLIYNAMQSGATTPAQLASFLDRELTNINPFKIYCQEPQEVQNLVFAWKKKENAEKRQKTIRDIRNLTVSLFCKLQQMACPSEAEWERILERAVDLTQKHEISQKLSSVQKEIYNSGKDIYTLNAEYTHSATEILSDTHKNAVVPICNHAEELIEAISDRGQTAVPTPFITLNTLLGGGFHNGKLYVLVAQPGGGKTTLAAQCADYAASSGIPVIFIPMEMGKEQLFIYSIARQGEINSAKIETTSQSVRDRIEGQLVENIGTYFNTTGRSLICTEGKFNTSPATIEIAISTVRAQMGFEKDKPMLVVVDYLQLLSTGNEALDYGQNETAKISELAVKVKQLARDNNVAVLAISDVTKKEQEGSWSNKELSLNSPRGSNRIAHSADCVMALYSEPSHSQGGKADADPWDVYTQKFKDDGTSREFIERLVEKKEGTELGGDGATVFSRLEIIKNRGGQGRGNQIMLYHRAYHKFETIEIGGHAQAERRA